MFSLEFILFRKRMEIPGKDSSNAKLLTALDIRVTYGKIRRILTSRVITDESQKKPPYVLGKTHFKIGEVERLETWIDRYHAQLPKLDKFILPVSIL